MSNNYNKYFIENSGKQSAMIDNNLEFVSIQTDYMVAINWMYNDGTDNSRVAVDEGKKWIEKYYDIRGN
jgi:hypothetical protein